PDVTLGYTVKPVIYGAIAAKRAGVGNVNSLVTGGGYTFISTSLKARVLGAVVRTLYKIGFGKADHVIFQNPDDMNEFCERGFVQREKCSFVNGSGVNISRFELVPYPKVVSFFMLSRLLKSKGVCEFLEAARIVKEKHPEVNFYLLGKYETAMQDAVEKQFVERFITKGIVERFDETSDVRPYYAKSSVYVLPSYREGTPRTVLEAMAMGRPIITTDTQGCRETVIDGKNGFLVPVKDCKAVAEKMFWFIEHPEKIKERGEESRKLVESKFDVNHVNADMIRIMNI
ncbi:MAG: glycosyltransferase family 4 protein, partial [Thermoguttaceae bacterium]|nr:glycosyltransferase family 4 protein [Thermoguttaceae bacterium]